MRAFLHVLISLLMALVGTQKETLYSAVSITQVYRPLLTVPYIVHTQVYSAEASVVLTVTYIVTAWLQTVQIAT